MRTLRWAWFDLLDWLERLNIPVAVPVTLLVMATIVTIGTVGRYTPRAVPQAQPTVALPIILIATAQPLPTSTPAAMIAVEQPPRYVVAFAAPDGAILGAIPQPRAEQITARFGDNWYMLEWNGGPAWVRAADLGLSIANLAPPEVVYVAAPAPVYAAPVAPQAAPACCPEPVEGPAVEAPVYEVTYEAPAVEQPPTAAPVPTHDYSQIVYPTSAPMAQTDIERRWAAEQWCQEQSDDCHR